MIIATKFLKDLLENKKAIKKIPPKEFPKSVILKHVRKVIYDNNLQRYIPKISKRNHGDVFHLNDIEALSKEMAASYPLFEAGDIILGDAFFPSYLFIAEMLDKGVDILMEQIGGRRQSTDFRLGSSLGKLDHIFEITKPGKKPDWIDQATFDKLPDTIAIREFKTKGRIMVTTMKDVKTYSKKSLYSLYKKRWEIETNLGQIKTILGMNVLSCKTPEIKKKFGFIS